MAGKHKDRNAQILDMHNRGVGSYADIASRLGLSRSTVAGVIHRFGTAEKDAGQSANRKSSARKVVTPRGTFPCVQTASEALGVSASSIRKWCRSRAGFSYEGDA